MDRIRVEHFLEELTKTLLTRTDGLELRIIRDRRYPKLDGQSLITGVSIKTWDVAA